MNLAFLAKRYDIVGGTERDLYELTRILSEFGHEVHVYCAQPRTPAAPGVQLHPVEVRGRGRTALLKSLAITGPAMAYGAGHDLVYSFARTLKQDVVRCGGGVHAAFLDVMASTQGFLGQWWRKFDPYHRAMLRIEAQQFRSGNYLAITAISNVVKKEILDYFDVPEDRIQVIYDGIDTRRFEEVPPETRQVARRKMGVSEDANLVVFVGNGFQRKGLDTLLWALAEPFCSDLQAVVVGTDQKASAYHRRAEILGVASRIHWAGVQERPEDYYAAGDLFVLPSHHEAFGNVVLEALASGLPCVVSTRAGASEVLESNLAEGILENPDDAQELGRRMAKLLEPDMRKILGVEARGVAARYSLEQNARNIEKQCLELIEAKQVS